LSVIEIVAVLAEDAGVVVATGSATAERADTIRSDDNTNAALRKTFNWTSLTARFAR
jgi:hypothetical protein